MSPGSQESKTREGQAVAQGETRTSDADLQELHHPIEQFFYVLPTDETLFQETAVTNDLSSFIAYWEKYWQKKKSQVNVN